MPQAPSHTQHRRRGPNRPRLGWPSMMCLLMVTACAAIVAAAWYLGGRATGQTSSVEALTTPRQEGSDIPTPGGDSGTAGTSSPQVPEARGSTSRPHVADGRATGSPPSAPSPSAARLPVELQTSHRPVGPMATLPGAADRVPVRSVPLDQLTTLHRLGWNVGQLHGFGQGMQPDDVVTADSGGVRTVQVHYSDGDHEITVAETRPAEESVTLRPLSEKLAELLDLGSVEQEQVTLLTGDDCTIYRSAAESRWTAAIDAGTVQYVITSDLGESAVPEVASWVMTTERSRLQQMPSSPDAGERLERGFRSLLGWSD